MRTFGRPSPPASSCKPHATCGCCAWQTVLRGTFVDFVECIRNQLFGILKRSAISAEFDCCCGQADRSYGAYGSLPHGEGQPGDPDSFTLFRPSRPFSPRFFPFFARFHRLAEAVPTSPKPESRAKKQCQGRANTVSSPTCRGMLVSYCIEKLPRPMPSLSTTISLATLRRMQPRWQR